MAGTFLLCNALMRLNILTATVKRRGAEHDRRLTAPRGSADDKARKAATLPVKPGRPKYRGKAGVAFDDAWISGARDRTDRHSLALTRKRIIYLDAKTWGL